MVNGNMQLSNAIRLILQDEDLIEHHPDLTPSDVEELETLAKKLEVSKLKSMTYEESKRNVNINGAQSVLLELDPDYEPFLDALAELKLDDINLEKVFDVLMILDGQCCEGDYIVTAHPGEEHDLQALECTINAHDWEDKPTHEELAQILERVKPLLRKRNVTWG